MEGLKAINLTIRFLLELGVLVAIGYWGFISKDIFFKIVLGLGTPLFYASLWALFGSPKAPYPLSTLSHWVLEIFLFGSAAIALYSTGLKTLSMIFIILAIINRLFMLLWKQ